MQKDNYQRIILPYIEMYGGNSDTWEVPVYGSNGDRMAFGEAQFYMFTLVIRDFSYVHRSNGQTHFYLTKAGTVTQDRDGYALVKFTFDPEDTLSVYGKYIYQILSVDSMDGERNAAQGELFITKAIDQYDTNTSTVDI